MASSSAPANPLPTTANPTQDDRLVQSSSSPPVIRDDSFYFSVVVFQVENTLFKIPGHVLSDHSDVFQTMFSLPTGENTAEGLTDDNPVVLTGITSYDFKQLLKVLYARAVLPPWTSTIPDQSTSQLPMTLAEWTPVLRLSDQWSMTAIHQFAIDKMSVMNIDPVDRLALAREFDIKPWKMPALNALAQRQEPMTRRDVDKLGLDVVLQIAEVRESLTRSPASGQMVVGKRQVGQMDFSSRISEVFSAEFKPLALGESPRRSRPRLALLPRSSQQSQGHTPTHTPQTTPAPSSSFTFNFGSTPAA